MSESNEPNLSLPAIPEGEYKLTRKDKRQRNRLKFRAEMFYTRKLIAYHLTHPDTGLPRIVTHRGVSNESLIEQYLQTIRLPSGERMFVAAIMPLRDGRKERDERGRKLPFPSQLMEAGHHIQTTYPEIANRVLVGGKWLYDEGLFPLLNLTFPKAIGCMAYVRGLGAPANAIFKDVDFTLMNILGGTDPFTGVQYAAGCDGDGRIHPDHYIFTQIGTVCVFQIRIWIPLLGCFWKGILVPDERCTDMHGHPTVFLDWNQGKGRHKASFKACLGSVNGAFDTDGVIVKPDELAEVPYEKLTQFLADGESLPAWQEELVSKYGNGGMHLSVMQDWSRHGKVKLCSQNFAMMEKNHRTEEIVGEFIVESFTEMAKKGGMNHFLDEVCEENEKPRITRMFCDKLGLNPLKVPMMLDMVHDAVARKLYHIAQGCGKFADRYVLVMDNSVPEGHVVVGHRVFKGEVQYTHGQKIALTRLPIVASQGLLTPTVINLEVDPLTGAEPKSLKINGKTYTRKRLMTLLGHLLIKSDNGYMHIKCAAVMNPKDVAIIFGDADGDFVLLNWDPRMRELHENRIAPWPDNPDAKFLFEPVPQEKGRKSSIPTVNADATMSNEAKEIIGLNGQGPVGAISVFRLAFAARNMRAHALAASDLEQTAIDRTKHDVLYNDPRKTIHREFWKDVEGNRWKPVGCEAPLGSEWYDDKGDLNMETFAKWCYSEMTAHLKAKFPGFDQKVTLAGMLQWRPQAGEPAKRIYPSKWLGMINPPIDGGNLVDYIFQYSHLMWEEFEKSYRWNLQDTTDVLLSELLPKTLGIKVYPLKYSGQPYRDLLNKSGLMDYGQFLGSIRKQAEMSDDLNSDEDNMRWRELKNIKVEAEYALLCHKLKQCTVHELITIWVTELEQADAIARKNRKNHGSNTKVRSPELSINRAFRAVAFPESPVLEALGLKFPESCPYLNGEELDNHFHLLNRMVEKGACTDIFHLGPFMRLINDRHKDVTGTPIKECSDCQQLIEDRIVSTVRHQKEGGDQQLLEVARKTANGMNVWLQGR